MNFSTFQPIKPASLRSDKRFAQRGWRRHWIGILLSAFSFQLFGVSVFAATYYIDYSSGSDSNSGTSTNAPWQRAPGMVAFSGSYSHSAGDVFIFKGGVTWPASSLGMVITQGGSATNPDIYESSTNWFSGASWTNACFDGQYTPVSFGGYSSLITVKADYITIRGLEVKRMLVPVTTSFNGFGAGSIAAAWNSGNYMVVQDCYIHDWKPATNNDSDYGGIFFWTDNGAAIHNRIGPGNPPDGFPSGSSGGGVHGGGLIQSNSITGCSELINTTATNISFNDLGPASNSFIASYHCNGIYHDTASNQKTWIYGNRVHDLGTTFMTMLLHVGIGGATNTTLYIFNNVLWNLPSAVDIDDWQISKTNSATVAYFLNNTLVQQGISAGTREAPYHVTGIDCENNLWINDATYPSTNPFGDYYVNSALYGQLDIRIDTNNVLLTSAQATADGYTIANQFAPTSSSSSSVGAGGNLTSLGLFTTDINGNPRPPTGAWDVGAYQYQAAVSSPAPVVSLVASPASITNGQSTTLTWSSVNATKVMLDKLGQVPLNGSTNISPAQVTTYTAKAISPTGTNSASVFITVLPAPLSPPSGLHVSDR